MSDKKKGTNFLMQGTILAAAAMITKIVGLAYRIPLTNIMGAEGNGYYGVVFQVYSLALMLTSYRYFKKKVILLRSNYAVSLKLGCNPTGPKM